jgi:signal transduction histidine kinase
MVECPMNGALRRLLVVGAEQGAITALRDAMCSRTHPNCSVVAATSLSDALAAIAAEAPDVVLLSLELPDSSGAGTLHAITSRHPELPIIVIDEMHDRERVVDRSGAVERVARADLDNPLLAKTIRHAAAQWRWQRGYRALVETLERRVQLRTARLRVMAASIARTEEKERRRLAQLLHDDLQQLLVAAKLNANMIGDGNDNADKVRLSRVDELMSQALDASRALTAELSPPLLYEQGFEAALAWLARNLRERHGLDVEVTSQGHRQPDEDIGVVAFLAVRELLRNVIAHAGVTEAKVMTSVMGDRVRIAVIDHGRGFDADRAQEPTPSGGIGLFSLRERVTLTGGTIDFDSRPGQTIVRIELPLSARPRPQRVDVRAPDARRMARSPEAAETDDSRSHVRVLVVDDHEVVREGFVGLLTSQTGIEVVGEAADGEEAIELAERLSPDVIVMDVTMPRLNGVDATRRIVARQPDVRIIGLSMHGERDLAAKMLEAGAVAYLSKGGRAEDLVAAVRQN